MKLIKVLRNYKDMQIGRDVQMDETFEVDDARAEELLNNPNGLIEIVKDLNPVKGEEKEVKKDEVDLTPPLKTPKQLEKAMKKKPAKKKVAPKKAK